MVAFAAGYQHFADGAPFAEMVLRHPSVKEVYFPWVGEPSGRPKLGFEEEDDPEELEAALKRDLERLKSAGIALDLLLNANCYGEFAMSRKLEARIVEIIGTLDAWGCRPDICTTASPFVAHVVKDGFHDIEVRASVNMRLTTIQAFRHLAPLFDSYYAGRDIQRNLSTIERFSGWCRANGKRLCILANSGCIRNCPWQTFHDNLIAHSDAAMKVDNVRGWCPHLCWTLYRGRSNLVEVLKSTWIRPEDIHRYDGLVDVVKLATRQHANPDMVMGAYERGSFAGNLLDLLEPGFSPAFFPDFIDNSSFPPDWFDRTSRCERECIECGYCESALRVVAARCGP